MKVYDVKTCFISCDIFKKVCCVRFFLQVDCNRSKFNFCQGINRAEAVVNNVFCKHVLFGRAIPIR